MNNDYQGDEQKARHTGTVEADPIVQKNTEAGLVYDMLGQLPADNEDDVVLTAAMASALFDAILASVSTLESLHSCGDFDTDIADALALWGA